MSNNIIAVNLSLRNIEKLASAMHYGMEAILELKAIPVFPCSEAPVADGDERQNYADAYDFVQALYEYALALRDFDGGEHIEF